jgi:hypothetical protein
MTLECEPDGRREDTGSLPRPAHRPPRGITRSDAEAVVADAGDPDEELPVVFGCHHPSSGGGARVSQFPAGDGPIQSDFCAEHG